MLTLIDVDGARTTLGEKRWTPGRPLLRNVDVYETTRDETGDERRRVQRFNFAGA